MKNPTNSVTIATKHSHTSKLPTYRMNLIQVNTHMNFELIKILRHISAPAKEAFGDKGNKRKPCPVIQNVENLDIFILSLWRY